MKKVLLFAAFAAAMMSMNAQDVVVQKLWGLDVPEAMAVADCRQGVGLNGKFYINDKANAKVLVFSEAGQENQEFEGGPNCGLNIDQAGHVIVSLATFPNADSWIFDDETAMIRVIDPATGEVTDLPLGSGAPNGGRMDVLGRAYGDLTGSGELYLPVMPADGKILRHVFNDGEVLGDDSYTVLLNPAPNADNMTIASAVVDAEGNDAIFYYQRGANPFLYYWNGDNLEGEQIAIPATDNGMIRCNQHGADFFGFNGKNYVVYPLGAANNAYFDGFGIVEVGADAPLFVKEPTIAIATNGYQANWLNAEVTEDGVLIYQYAPGKTMEVYKMSLAAEPVDQKVYIDKASEGNFWAWDKTGEDWKNYFDNWPGKAISELETETVNDVEYYVFEFTGESNFGMIFSDGNGQTSDIVPEWGKLYKYNGGSEYEVSEIPEVQPEPEPFAPDLFVSGTFNEWAQLDGALKMDVDEDGIYTASFELEENGEFKIITPNPNPEDTEAPIWWFGGLDENQVGFFLLYGDQEYNDVELLLDGSNFRAEKAGKYTLTVKIEKLPKAEAPHKVIVLNDQPYALLMSVVAEPFTGVADLNADNISSVKYVNMAGQVSATPFEGVNIMVTTMTDGTKKAVKVIR